MDDDLMNALHKLAIGFTHSDMQDEQSADDEGKMKTIRRKVTKKYYPPDINALKAYLEVNSGQKTESLSDMELQCEKERLLKKLADSTPISVGGKTLNNAPKKATDVTTDVGLKKEIGNAPKKTTGNAPKKATSNAPKKTTGNAPKKTTGNAPKKATGNAPKKATSNAPKKATSNAPKKTITK